MKNNTKQATVTTANNDGTGGTDGVLRRFFLFFVCLEYFLIV